MTVDMLVLAIFLVLECIFIGAALGVKPAYTIVNTKELSDLSCYKCYRSVDGENCVTVERPQDLDNETCTTDKPYCMVERYIVGNEIATFTRKCSSRCLTGCQRLNEIYVIEKCWECCHENMCNIGQAKSSAGSAIKSVPTGLLLFIFLLGLKVNF